jgi:hypothetical protein
MDGFGVQEILFEQLILLNTISQQIMGSCSSKE